jgi:ABC-type sugar transport system substrate-binding protein
MGHRTRHLLGAIALLVTAVVVLAACGSGSDSSSSGGSTSGGSDDGGSKSVYGNYPGQEFPYYQAIKKGEEDTAKELGWEFQSDFADNNPEEQVSQIETALVKEPDGLLISPVTSDSVVPAVRLASERGIPVVAVANNIAEPDLLLTFTGTENTKIGTLKAEYIVKALGGKGRVGVIHGVQGRPFSDEQAEASEAVFAENPGIEVIDGGYANGYTSDVALDKTQTLLTRSGGVDAMYYDNDDQSLGGIKALEARGEDNVVVVGSDGTPAGLEAVKEGKMAYTLSLCGYDQGVEAMTLLAENLDEGVEPPPSNEAKFEQVTAQTLKDPAKYKQLREQKCS